MSGRVRTSKERELQLDALYDQLSGSVDRRREKWRVLRLGLAVSMRLPVNPKDTPAELSAGVRRDGAEYRLQQVTGEGKSGEELESLDLTDALRALLGALHDRDLFDRTKEPDGFESLLEFHIDRGLGVLHEAWRADGDLYSAMTRLLAPPSERAVKTQATDEVSNVVAAFAELQIIVRPRGEPVVGPRLTHYALFVPDPNDYDRILAGLNKLAFVLGQRADTLTVHQGAVGGAAEAGKVLTLAVPRPRASWRSPGADALRLALDQRPAALRLPLAFGVDPMGAPFFGDLAEAPHLLLGGSTGSGKSVALHGLLCGLIRLPPTQLRLHLCDAKGTELVPYQGLEVLGGQPVATTAEAIHDRVNALVEHMESYYVRLQQWGHQNHYAAWDAGHREQPSEVLVIDELTDLLMARPQAEAALVRLAQMGRAAGVHLILATQRPDARTLSGNLRTNIPARAALAVQRASESQIILGVKGAEALLPPGDMLVLMKGGAPARAHAYDLRPDDVASAVRNAPKRTTS